MHLRLAVRLRSAIRATIANNAGRPTNNSHWFGVTAKTQLIELNFGNIRHTTYDHRLAWNRRAHIVNFPLSRHGRSQWSILDKT